MRGDYLSNKSGNRLSVTLEFLGQEKKQEVILPYELEDDLEGNNRKEKFLAQYKKK